MGNSGLDFVSDKYIFLTSRHKGYSVRLCVCMRVCVPVCACVHECVFA